MSSRVSPILLGDSIFKRLLAEFSSDFSVLSARTSVSGIRVAELKRVIKDVRLKLSGSTAVLLVGANDVVKGTPLKDLKLQLKSLIRYLVRIKVKLTVLEILPIPRYENKPDIVSYVLEVNKFIRSFKSDKVRVLNTQCYFTANDRISVELYCKYLRRDKVDLLHPNKLGLRKLRDIIKEALCLE